MKKLLIFTAIITGFNFITVDGNCSNWNNFNNNRNYQYNNYRNRNRNLNNRNNNNQKEPYSQRFDIYGNDGEEEEKNEGYSFSSNIYTGGYSYSAGGIYDGVRETQHNQINNGRNRKPIHPLEIDNNKIRHPVSGNQRNALGINKLNHQFLSERNNNQIINNINNGENNLREHSIINLDDEEEDEKVDNTINRFNLIKFSSIRNNNHDKLNIEEEESEEVEE